MPCPECDGPLIKQDTFCRACGWDADLAEDEYLDGVGVDLSPGDFDYEQALASEGLSAGDSKTAPRAGPNLGLLLVGFLLVLALVLYLAGGLR